MHVFASPAAVASTQRPSACAIGNFDGVHRGHQALLNCAMAQAAEHDLLSLAYTFEPHPAAILNPSLAPELIEPLAVRLERLEAMGLGAVLVQPFDRAFAATSAEAYVTDILLGCLRVRHVCIGQGFTFGSKQRGNVHLLAAMGDKFGFVTHAIEHVRVEGIEASSTKVREFVRTGHLAGATLLLGRLFELRGIIGRGAQRGAKLGFPTANLVPDNVLMPATGVYACWAHGPFGRAAAVTNVGVAPTFGDSMQVRVEAHLLDYSGPPLYDTRMRLEFATRLRDEQRFDGIEALKTQLNHDVAAARRALLG